jgi:DNA-binding XRE family transcriptional regulator
LGVVSQAGALMHDTRGVKSDAADPKGDMKQQDIVPFCYALSAARRARGLTQADVAGELGISRKTYILLESARWLPPSRQRSHVVRVLHGLFPAVAEELVKVFGDTLADYVQVQSVVQVAPARALEATHAKLVFDSAVLGVAEELDASPRMLRPLLAGLLARLDAAGMPMAQAAGLAKAAVSPPAVTREKS